MEEEKGQLRYVDFGEDDLRCPCYGKKLMKIKAGPEFANSLVEMIKTDPDSLPTFVLEMFRIAHSPELGLPVDLPMEGEQN